MPYAGSELALRRPHEELHGFPAHALIRVINKLYRRGDEISSLRRRENEDRVKYKNLTYGS